MNRSGHVSAFLLLVLCATAAAAECLAPAWETRTTKLTSGSLVNTLAVGDMNEDGLLDVITIKRGPIDEVILAPGILPKGYFGAGLPVHSGPTLRAVIARDLNSDNHLDLLVFEDENETVAFFPGNGDGTFGAMTRSALRHQMELPVTDFTGDQIDDIAAVFSDISGVSVVIFKGNATGVFAETQLRTALRTFPLAVAAADLDGDGAADLVVGNTDDTIDLFFGNGDGTFDPVVTKASGTFNTAVTLDDIEGDGDVDILTSSSPNTLTIHRNLGGRLFSASVDHLIASPFHSLNGAFDFAAADFTGDGVRDILASAHNGGYVATLRGRGDGTFEEPTFDSLQHGQYVGPVGAMVDLDDDGRLDIITTNYGITAANPGAVALLNRCGELTVTLSGEPVVSVGTTATFRVATDGVPYNYFSPRVKATGNVTILEGETVIDTAPLDADGNVSVTLPALALGNHTLVARYAGDAQYEPAQSAPFAQRVTAETTTTEVSTSPSESVYGEQVTIHATVTASDGTTPTGLIDVGLANSSWEAQTLPNAGGVVVDLSVGSHTGFARYHGDATHPRSEATITHVVRKATPTVTIPQVAPTNQSGSNATVYVNITNEFHRPLTGTVLLYDRNVLIATRELSGSSSVAFGMVGLGAGRHDFSARYSGDSNFNAAASELVTHQTFPASASGLALDARGSSVGIHLIWAKPAPATGNWTWIVCRSVAPSLNFVVCPFSGSFPPALDEATLPGTVYLYRFELREYTTQQVVDTSAIDLGVRMSFSDDPLLAGMTVRASHLQEILAATNFLRGKAGQSAVTFSDLGAGKVIRASHIATLATRINEARVALGAAPVTWSRTIAAGDVVRAQDLQELREAVH